MAELKEFVQEPLRQRHCADLAKHLSVADMRELMASGEWDPTCMTIGDLLSRAVQAEGFTHYAIRNKRSGCVYAVGGYGSDGLCWFLTSKLVAGFTKEERWSFRMMLRRNLIETLGVHDVLFNVVWNQNEDHLRLIKSMGARIGSTDGQFTSFSFHREDFSEFQH